MAAIPLNIFSAVHVGQRMARLAEQDGREGELGGAESAIARPVSPSRFLRPIQDGDSNQPQPLLAYLVPIMNDIKQFNNKCSKELVQSFQAHMPVVEVPKLTLVGQEEIVATFSGSEALAVGRQ